MSALLITDEGIVFIKQEIQKVFGDSVFIGTAEDDAEASASSGKAHGYESLSDVLSRAFNQAAKGKGAERHATGLPFDQQPMQQIIKLYGDGFALGQAAKKMQEAQRMESEAAVRELLGAINYIAGAIIYIEREIL